jgi:hypothetical protein
MGLIAMSERDLQRIEILSKVVAGRMTTVSAAHVLDLSERQVRRLLERMRTGGAASIRHKAIGRPSNNRISDGVRDYAIWKSAPWCLRQSMQWHRPTRYGGPAASMRTAPQRQPPVNRCMAFAPVLAVPLWDRK